MAARSNRVTAPAPITTERLLLRAFTPGDADAVRAVAGAFEIADMTLSIPHPYALEDAHKFMALVQGWYKADAKFPMAITLRTAPATLVGCVGLDRHDPNNRAELGYWIGVAHWGKGYATEASAAVLRWGFESLNLNKIIAHHFGRNPASGRVLEKLGMRREGLFRRHTKKWNGYEDIVAYGILREEFGAHRNGQGHPGPEAPR
jgi:RimJ/RimL family protein N-acetyltransferase